MWSDMKKSAYRMGICFNWVNMRTFFPMPLENKTSEKVKSANERLDDWKKTSRKSLIRSYSFVLIHCTFQFLFIRTLIGFKIDVEYFVLDFFFVYTWQIDIQPPFSLSLSMIISGSDETLQKDTFSLLVYTWIKKKKSSFVEVLSFFSICTLSFLE
jgi:hypothetical protein